jgi:PEP-CTERM motif
VHKNIRKKTILMMALPTLMSLVSATAAADITNLQVYDGSRSPIVTVTYTNIDGTGHNSATTYADPQVSGGTANPLYYCIDLWHENDPGSSYAITPVSSISFADTSTFADVDNRLAWLVNQPQATVDERAAVQLALWYTTDNKGFSYSGGDRTLYQDYKRLICFAGYNPSVIYGAEFWDATRPAGSSLDQNLISAVPEPSTLLLAALGMVAMVGYHFGRRPPWRPAAA